MATEIVKFCKYLIKLNIIAMLRQLFVFVCGILLAMPAFAADTPAIAGIQIEFILFALTLLGVALFHHRTFYVALTGLVSITAYKLVFTGFKAGAGLHGLLGHLEHEWVTLANLFCLLMGFGILSRHFEKSRVPVILPKYLPDDWKGAFGVLLIVWIMSSFLDNIAAAMIGGAMAHQLFRAKVHIGYLAAIVAASNAGGAFSVVGDTTTTMMWIAGVSPLEVFHAITASATALLVFGYFASRQQHAYSPIIKNAHEHTRIEWRRIFIVATILVFAMITNIVVNMKFADISGSFPFIGAAVALAIIVTAPVRRHDWEVLGESMQGTLFLLFLVTAASMMPVDKLPPASWQTALGLGVVSSMFDNIPLTALAIRQDGYDWGVLAFAVGFGGSMLWFGSSAGVALSNQFPEAKSAGLWLRQGWHVALAFIAAFLVMLAVHGWQPVSINKGEPVRAVQQQETSQAAQH